MHIWSYMHICIYVYMYMYICIYNYIYICKDDVVFSLTGFWDWDLQTTDIDHACQQKAAKNTTVQLLSLCDQIPDELLPGEEQKAILAMSLGTKKWQRHRVLAEGQNSKWWALRRLTRGPSLRGVYISLRKSNIRTNHESTMSIGCASGNSKCQASVYVPEHVPTISRACSNIEGVLSSEVVASQVWRNKLPAHHLPKERSRSLCCVWTAGKSVSSSKDGNGKSSRWLLDDFPIFSHCDWGLPLLCSNSGSFFSSL